MAFEEWRDPHLSREPEEPVFDARQMRQMQGLDPRIDPDDYIPVPLASIVRHDWPILGKITSIDEEVDGIRVRGWLTDEGKIEFNRLEYEGTWTPLTETEWLIVWSDIVLHDLLAQFKGMIRPKTYERMQDLLPRICHRANEIKTKGEQNERTQTASPSRGRRIPAKKR